MDFLPIGVSKNKRVGTHRRGRHSTWDARAWPQDPDLVSPALRAWILAQPDRAFEFQWVFTPTWLPDDVRARITPMGRTVVSRHEKIGSVHEASHLADVEAGRVIEGIET